MTFSEGLRNARSHIVFLLGLLSAGWLVASIQSWEPGSNQIKEHIQATSRELPAPARPRPLTGQERTWAHAAWKYFENNYQPATGLVNSVDQYPASTMWDTGSYLMAAISAQRLGIIGQAEFDEKVSRALASLAKMKLFDNRLPNKSYNTISLAMVDYNDKVIDRGVGWSAIDVGRLLVPFNILIWNYPQHNQAVRSVLERWDIDRVIRNGQLWGSKVDDRGNTVTLQEGRFGYEQYSAKSFGLIGFDTSTAGSYYDHLQLVNVEGLKIPADDRSADKYQAHVYAVSEPYILDGVEFGWDISSRAFAHAIYEAQVKRFRHTGIVTAVSEDNLDQAPYFAYNTVWADGTPWGTITDQGKDLSNLRTLSTKAAIGWLALYQDDYSGTLRKAVADLVDSGKGWYAGRYERTGKQNRVLTANTNAIVLESLCYIQFGAEVRPYKP